MPVAIPQNVPTGAQQSSRRRTMTWLGTAMSSSMMLPRRSQRALRFTSASGASSRVTRRKMIPQTNQKKTVRMIMLAKPPPLVSCPGGSGRKKFMMRSRNEKRLKAPSVKMAQSIEKTPARKRFARKNAVTMTGIFTGRRAGRRRSLISIGSSSNNAWPASSMASQSQ